DAYPGESLIRYRAEVVVPREIRSVIAMLKGIVAGFVLSHDGRQPLYANQRELLIELADLLWQRGSSALEVQFAGAFGAAADDAARRRVIVDQVASLTDQSAIAWYGRMTGAPTLQVV
ncbi:MAG: deoxyguanosinetriphosphate triphosphohydrolase, partial [Pseudoclavibacter sp.]